LSFLTWRGGKKIRRPISQSWRWCSVSVIRNVVTSSRKQILALRTANNYRLIITDESYTGELLIITDDSSVLSSAEVSTKLLDNTVLKEKISLKNCCGEYRLPF